MVLTLSISSQAETLLAAKAAAAGVDVVTYATETLERLAARPTLEQTLLPLRAEFDRSGLTEDELIDLLEQAKHQQRAEDQVRPR